MSSRQCHIPVVQWWDWSTCRWSQCSGHHFVYWFFFFFSDVNPRLHWYSDKVRQTLAASLQPRTKAVYQQQLRQYIAFAWFLGVRDLSDVDLLLAFMQFLLDSDVSGPTIANYVSALKHELTLYNVNVQGFSHSRVTIMLRGIRVLKRVTPQIKSIISLPMLNSIINQCGILQYPFLFKAIFLVAFFTFLRLSNFAVSSASRFDPSKHFTVQDFVDCRTPYLRIKWEKNWQLSSSPRSVFLPCLPSSNLCPVTALRRLLHHNKLNSRDPLFAATEGIPITFHAIRKALAHILVSLGLPYNAFTFHSFRRSGASLAFNSEVPVSLIKAHGGWKSSAVLRYIQPDARSSQAVSAKFTPLLENF